MILDAGETRHCSNIKNFEYYTGTSYWMNLVWKLKLEYLLLALEDWGCGHKVHSKQLRSVALSYEYSAMSLLQNGIGYQRHSSFRRYEEKWRIPQRAFHRFSEEGVTLCDIVTICGGLKQLLSYEAYIRHQGKTVKVVQIISY
jgi:hypothetical protein